MEDRAVGNSGNEAASAGNSGRLICAQQCSNRRSIGRDVVSVYTVGGMD